MNARKRFWLALVAPILAMAIIACSCGSFLPTLIATPTQQQEVLPPNPAPTRTTIPSVNSVDYTALPYYDDFSDPTSGWNVYSDGTGAAGYRDGYYYLTSINTSIKEDGYANKFFGNTVIEVDITPVSGPANNNYEYGLSCRVQPNYDGYDFFITPDGYFAVYLITDGGSTYASLLQGDEYQASSAIQQGYATNHIQVTCAGSQLKFEVNGVTLFEGQDSTFSDGDIRFSIGNYNADTSTEIHFDNLAVTAP